MARKYRLEPEGEGLYRVIAVKDFKISRGQSPQVKEGDRGGLVSGPYNLSHRGQCWIEEDAKVIDQAKVLKDGLVLEKATISGRAVVTDLSWVAGSAQVQDNARIQEGGAVVDHATVRDGATVRSAGIVGGQAIVEHRARVEDGAMLGDKARVGGNAVISGQDTVVTGNRYIIKGLTKNETAPDTGETPVTTVGSSEEIHSISSSDSDGIQMI